MYEGEVSSQGTARRVLDTVSEGMAVVDGDGCILHMNAYAARMLSVSMKAEGKHFRDLFYPHLPLQKCCIKHAIGNREIVRSHRFEMERDDGCKPTLIADLTPIVQNDTFCAGALIGLQPADKNGRLHLKWRCQADVVVMVDNKKRIIYFNRAAERITGWKEQEVLEKFASQIYVASKCLDSRPSIIRKHLTKPIINFDTEPFHDRGGRKRPMYVNLAHMSAIHNDVIVYLFTC